MLTFLRSLAVVCLSAAAFSLAGCALTETASPIAEQGAALVGNVHGGQQPVVGAHVYLMQANTTAVGAASISLLQSAKTGLSDSIGAYVTTDGNGAFSISSDYSCTANTQVYIYALGGNPGSGTNSYAGFLAALGNCPAAGNFAATVPFIWVNEVSTVAAAYAFAGYATDALHVSSSGTTLAQIGIANAFATAANMVNPMTGAAYTTPPTLPNLAVPQMTINTIANILASCVNTNGSCGTLVAAAKSGGSTGTSATDTATIAINIAHNPGANVGIIYSLLPASPAFAPPLPSAPNDYTVSLTYTGGGISKPEGLAVDASGNVWVANFAGTGITKILATGAFAPNSPFTAGGIGTAEAVAIDASGNAWVVNSNHNTLSKLTSAGAASGSSPFSGGNMTTPDALAIDANGYIWVGNSTRGVCINAFNPSTSTFTTATGYTVNGGCAAAYGIAIDGSGNVWEVNNDISNLVEFAGSSSGSMGTQIRAMGSGGIASPDAVAVNSADVWVANGARNSTDVSEFNVSNGQPLTTASGATGGGVSAPYSVATDGAGNMWFANSGSSVSEFSSGGSALSPSGTGYQGNGVFNTPYAIAVDGSGNVWVADEVANTVVEMVGLATPVVTPLVAGLHTPYTPGSQP